MELNNYQSSYASCIFPLLITRCFSWSFKLLCNWHFCGGVTSHKLERSLQTSRCMCVQPLSYVLLFATLWTVAYQAPLSMGFFRQENQSGLPFSTLVEKIYSSRSSWPRDQTCIFLCLPHWQADFLPLRHMGSPASV